MYSVADQHLFKVKQFLISNDFFEKGYATGNSPCHCTSQCCAGGVWMDLKDYEQIMARKDLIKQQMDETQTADDARWFDDELADDSDFPSGKAVGTEVVNDKCAFLDKFGRCSIQLAAVAAGEHKWKWKPLYCILFPVEVSNGVVSFDPMLQGDESCCTVSTVFETPLFRACKEELTHLLGSDGYAMLEAHYASLRQGLTADIKG
jgi:hypothetical protein